MTFNTGNNVPSTDPRDLYDNAENLDKLVNGADPFYADRKGKLRQSWAGMENTFDTSQTGRENAFVLSQADKESRFQAFLVSSGYVSKGDYAAGVVLAERNEYVAVNATTTGTTAGLYRPGPGATLPLTLTGTWAADSANLVLLGDDVLRQELAAGDAPLVAASAVSLEGGGSLDRAVYPIPGGALADGVTDVTLIMQAALDAIPDNSVIRIPPGRYRVRKNTALTGFPNNDQPALLLRGKTNVRIIAHGAVLVVNEHAQGALEIQQCTGCRVIGLRAEGAGDFPPLDGVTGRGEKGTETEGYHTSGFWGYYKNNSNDTSANTGGGFGGAFPQYSGGTAPTWGTWNNGYIGNVSYGILIHNDCHDVVLEGCDAEGFNYVGIAVGHNGDFFPTDLGYPDSTNVRFLGCTGSRNYSAGFHSMAVDGFALTAGSAAEDNGHPNSNPAMHTYCDPGYGYTARGTIYSRTKNGGVTASHFKGNKRKGIDSHCHTNLLISGNTVKDSPISGIATAWAGSAQPAVGTIITGNTLENVSTHPTAAIGAIQMAGDIDTGDPITNGRLDAVISGNLVRGWGYRGIEVRFGRGVTIQGNTVADAASTGATAIHVGRDGADVSYDLTVSGNTVSEGAGFATRGIEVRNADRGSVSGNAVRLTSTNTGSIGVYSISNAAVSFTGNIATLGTGGTPLALAQTTGLTEGNLGFGGSSPSFLYSTNATRLRGSQAIRVLVTFNGTTSPVVSVQSGSDYVAGVVTTATGFSINMKNLPSAGARVSSSIVPVSASGPKAGANFVGFWYQRSAAYNAVEIGLRLLQSSAGHTDGSTVTEGSLLVTIFID